MKIEPSLPQVTLSPSVENRTSQHQTGKNVSTEQATAVSLSQQSAQLKELETQLAAIPVVDRARVDNIKQAISSGQYSINTENISDQLLNSVKEMLNVAK